MLNLKVQSSKSKVWLSVSILQSLAFSLLILPIAYCLLFTSGEAYAVEIKKQIGRAHV